ncbi:hypothetical protein T484DRAFT_1913446, partial [Baffinella frigidus]
MEEEVEACLVCCEDLRVAAVGSCNHRGVCALCSVRLRQLLGDSCCILCKRELDRVIMTADVTKTFESFPIWGDVCRVEGRELYYDEESQSFFDDDVALKETLALRSFACVKCPPAPAPGYKATTLKDLRGHLSLRHKVVACELCVDNRKVFAQEFELFLQKDLRIHDQHGDQDGGPFKGHPLCEFCKLRMYDDNALWTHLRKSHYTCHLCERHRGVTNEFLNNYDDLEAHFRSLHFTCEDEGCLEQKFVAFNSEVELQAHCAQTHMSNAPRRSRQVALPVQWTLTRRPDADRATYSGETLPRSGSREREREERRITQDNRNAAK